MRRGAGARREDREVVSHRSLAGRVAGLIDEDIVAPERRGPPAVEPHRPVRAELGEHVDHLVAGHSDAAARAAVGDEDDRVLPIARQADGRAGMPEPRSAHEAAGGRTVVIDAPLRGAVVNQRPASAELLGSPRRRRGEHLIVGKHLDPIRTDRKVAAVISVRARPTRSVADVEPEIVIREVAVDRHLRADAPTKRRRSTRPLRGSRRAKAHPRSARVHDQRVENDGLRRHASEHANARVRSAPRVLRARRERHRSRDEKSDNRTHRRMLTQRRASIVTREGGEDRRAEVEPRGHVTQ